MSRVLHEATEDALLLLPPFLRQDPTVQGTTDAIFRELTRLQESADELQINFYPHSADRFLGFWEALFNLSATGKTLEQRRDSVLHFLNGLKSSGYGSAWETLLASIAGAEVVYSEFTPYDLRGLLWERYPAQTLGPDWEWIGFAPDPSNLVLESDGYRLIGLAASAVQIVAEDQFVDVKFKTDDETAAMGFGVAAFLKYLDADNYLLMWQSESLRLYQRIAGVTTEVDIDSTGVLDPDTAYWLRAKITGDDVVADVYEKDPIRGGTPIRSVAVTLAGAPATALGTGVVGKMGFLIGPSPLGWKLQGIRLGEAGWSVPDYTVRITMPLDPTSPVAGELERLLRATTPANLDLEIFYDEGFILGVSELGQEAL